MRNITLEDVKYRIEMEGLEYTVMNYFSAENIEDPELSKLWEEAKESMLRVEKYIVEKTGEIDYQ